MADPASKPSDTYEASIEEVRRICDRAKALAAKEPAEGRDLVVTASPPPPAPTAKIYQLPLWPEPVRGAPNSFLRSALFAAIQGKTRKRVKKQFLASIHNVTVRYTGEQLDQSIFKQMVPAEFRSLYRI